MLRDNNKKRRIVVVGKGGSGGGIDQVQSDWNQTDNTQVDYIKNKPTVYNEWFGTQVEYDAISVKDPDTIYYIEDASGTVIRDGKTYGIKVHITDPELEDLSVTSNGTYQSSTKYGYDEVTVNVQPNLTTLNATTNDTYTPTAPVQGYSSVTVNVPAPVLDTLNATSNGTFTPSAGVDGFDEVNVSVQPNLQNKTVNQNGTVTADQGYDGLGTVTVNVTGDVWPTYLTATYFVSEPSNNFEILTNTNGISGYRIKGASTWESPVTSIAVNDIGTLELEFQLTDPTRIEDNVFIYREITKIELPSSITYIGDSNFFNTRLLGEIAPSLDNITYLGSLNFYSTALVFDKIYYDTSVNRDWRVSQNGAKCMRYMLVNGRLLHYMDGGFEGAGRPSYIDLSNGVDGHQVTEVWAQFRDGWQITEIKFPSTLTGFDMYQFSNSEIGNVYFYSTTPPTTNESTVFESCNITGNIYVPTSAVSAYQNSSAFADVVSKIQAMP